MKKLLTILLSFSFTSLLYGQDAVDSILRNAAAGKLSTAGLKNLLDISEAKLNDKPDSALWIAQRAKDLSAKINYAGGVANALFIMGKVYKQKGNYPKALELYRQSQKEYEKLNDRGGVASNLLFTGEINSYQGNYTAALNYYLQAKGLFEMGNKKYAVASTLLKIGENYELQNRPDSALFYLRQIESAGGDKAEIEGIEKYIKSRALYTVGKIYAQKGKLDLAMHYYSECLPKLREAQEDRSIAQVMLSMAEVFRQQGQRKDSCLKYAKQSLAVAENAGFLLEIMKAADFLAHYYKQYRQTDSALAYLETSIAAKDSLFSREKVQSVQNQFFADERLKDELEASKLEQKAKELRLKNRTRIIALFASTLVFLVIVFLLWRNNRQKQKANVLLELQKQEVQNALTELKTVQGQLIHAEKMASLVEVTAGIAHEIQNPLNFINNFSEVGTELLTEMKEAMEAGKANDALDIMDELSEGLKRIQQHGTRADAIVKNMMEHSRKNTSLPEPTDINGLVEECLRLSYQNTKNKDKSFHAVLETHLDHGVGKVDMIPQEMGRVLLNLFSNAFYSVRQKKKELQNGYEPTLQVTTRKVDDVCEIRVRDNGVGISEKVIDKIYQPFFTTKPAGDGTGLGLSMSYDIVTKVHGGRLNVQTKQGEYAEFIVTVPI